MSLLFFFIFPLVISLTHPAPGDSNDSKSGILWITHNIEVALTKSRVKHLPNLEGPIGYETYKQLPLQSKPNIYLIFLEAYGTVVGSVSPYDLPYRNQLKNFESNLQSKGWYSVSTLSNSTILGGRSWLGFTTFISGLHIDNHPEYEKLIHEHVGFPHLINTLNDQGYTTYRLNTMSNEGSSFRALDSVAGRFFNVSSWTKYSDIPYKGYQYDYFGGIPDQYALWYWHDHVLQKKAEPYFLFFITLSTHAPFYLPPPIRTDWKSLDTIRTSPHNTVRSEDPKPLDRYSQSVAYILKVWENYILQAADSNDLFILVGDHQPAGMEFLIKGKTDTYATPMHIITKDPEWVTLLKDKGFTSGMLPEFKPGSLMHHEGFYSLWMNIWAQKDSIQNHPPYLPVGIE